MKKNILKTFLVLAASLSLFTACATKPAETTPSNSVAPVETAKEDTTKTETEPKTEPQTDLVKVTVGATELPHAQILEQIKEDLKAEGIDLDIKVFSDYTLLNQALFDKQIDANFFQHTPFLDDYVAKSKQPLVSLGNVHIEPMGVYSIKIKDLKELADGAVVSIPNDATNEGRALLLLQANGLIKLKDGVGTIAGLADITENTKNLKFNEIDAALLPRILTDTDIAVINTNYALEGGLNPLKDSLAIEGNDSPYANILVVREEDADSKELNQIYKALTTEKIREFLLKTYEGSVVPAF